MARCRDRYRSGGILGLVNFVDEHYEALEYDLITSAGVELNDVGGSLSWGAFASFIKNLGMNSSTWKDTYPEFAEWDSRIITNAILADIYDVLSQINANLVGGFGRKRPPKIKPYPRPWKKPKVRKIGSGALPVDALEKWIEEKRRKAGG